MKRYGPKARASSQANQDYKSEEGFLAHSFILPLMVHMQMLLPPDGTHPKEPTDGTHPKEPTDGDRDEDDS
ncbi:hypothetical protein BV898_05504 [Hypsibius exemplaris]|uniref:Uncharacterized protein n=1 Tax=Hypsibius exemplaris TaxID=2072580 RepID=A0A1W0WZ31_HYPEX|nr:hypothetical protein BV898_05504 [Hypsibius exemplaris]